MSAASVLDTSPRSGFIRGTDVNALMMVAGFVPLRMLFRSSSGFGPWHDALSEHDRYAGLIFASYSCLPLTAFCARALAPASSRALPTATLTAVASLILVVMFTVPFVR